MKQSVSKVYKPLFQENTRYFVLMGGRGAGRSTVASQLANTLLVSDQYFRCAIMRYVLGDIRNSIFREIKDRAEENGVINSLSINESLMSIKYGDNSINAVGFKKSSSDQKSKLKSLANYNYVIIEEADEIPEEDFIQLDDSLRTLKGDIKIILLLNPPPKTHWIIEKWFDLEEAKDQHGSKIQDFHIPKLKPQYEKDTTFIYANYKDNEKNLARQSIINYENYKYSKPKHYYNMVVGLVPETATGKIYSGWKLIDSVPQEARLEKYGLDFGYTNDPTAIDAIYKWNNSYVIDEVWHQKNMSNKQIADVLLSLEDALVIADSSEPKSIDEIASYGVKIVGSVKGQGSVNQGIQFVQDQQIFITRRSVNTYKEYQNYVWLVDKDGNVLNVPVDLWNHHLDDIRYAIASNEKKVTWKPNDPGGVKPHISGTLA